ncbi:MAG: bifunctional 5,10-methylenetetrahydrofolate dehydrogenase/5,10-methenyltetrahydrofolate cyclohydrolase [Candidatus Omnitrophica bacterium]|nr:bifunctional 5,10-methylenetetrahydrofolate dehydrogenase/5,10-methenyltetrahydrofolate cyclohydrolase [Candidatus Omnitrophota bacterium]
MPVKEAKLLEGKVLAQQIQEEIRNKIEGYISKGMPRPSLLALQAGKNPASSWYINQQEKLAAKLGVGFQKNMLGEILNQNVLMQKISEAEKNPNIHGIFLAQPFPEGFDRKTIIRNLDNTKDVEGITPGILGLMVSRETEIIPPTAFAAFRLIESTGLSLRGKRITIIGQSAIVARPLAMLLGEHRATVTICNTGTSAVNDLEKYVSESDIVIACSGQPGIVKGNWIKPGAVVIDVGTTEVAGKLVGDVEFEEAKKRAAFITPVPGGVGPLTVTMLMQNLIRAYEWQQIGEKWETKSN